MISFFEQRLKASGLVEPDSLVVAAREDRIFWNRADSILHPVFSTLLNNSSASALIFAFPAKPYSTIIDYLCSTEQDAIYPRDCETRTFFHSFPVCRRTSPEAIGEALRKGKAVIIPGWGIVTTGAMTLEQAFVNFSSVCFACFVKFYSDYLTAFLEGTLTDAFVEALDQTRAYIPDYVRSAPTLMNGTFCSEEDIYRAMIEAGKMTVDLGLVDSFFGNISFYRDPAIYISQTGASLDYLAGCIDPCTLDHSSCAGITASSEFSAHRAVYDLTDAHAIVHGHPRFSVILSMVCDRRDCPLRGQCHLRCPEKRHIGDIPIVSGEVGTGEFGLCNTVPLALVESRGVIVYGHGVFTTARDDFNQALQSLLDIERMCRSEFFARIE